MGWNAGRDGEGWEGEGRQADGRGKTGLSEKIFGCNFLRGIELEKLKRVFRKSD